MSQALTHLERLLLCVIAHQDHKWHVVRRKSVPGAQEQVCPSSSCGITQALLPLSSSSMSAGTDRFPSDMLLSCSLLPGSISRAARRMIPFPPCLHHLILWSNKCLACPTRAGEPVLLFRETNLPPSCPVPPYAENPLWLWDYKCVSLCRLKRNLEGQRNLMFYYDQWSLIQL